MQARRKAGEEDAHLIAAIEAALQQSGVLDNRGELKLAWRRRLDKLTYLREDQLRRLVARHALTYTHRDQPVPEDLRSALNWPAEEEETLKTLLLTLRNGLTANPEWRALIEYFNDVATVEQQFAIERALLNLDRLVVDTEQGQALRASASCSGGDPNPSMSAWRSVTARRWRMNIAVTLFAASPSFARICACRWRTSMWNWA